MHGRDELSGRHLFVVLNPRILPPELIRRRGAGSSGKNTLRAGRAREVRPAVACNNVTQREDSA